MLPNPNESVIVVETVPVRFGVGATRELGYELTRRDVKRALVITDPHISGLGLATGVIAVIEEAGVEVVLYDQVHAEPDDRSFEQALRWQESQGEFDAYVAFGGGSVIDTAKAMNLYGTYPAPLLRYVNAPIGEGAPVPGPLKPLIAVPTTAGTGSECTPVIVLDLHAQHIKTGISHPAIRPTAAIIDPLHTVTMPPVVTAASGLDVLCHALESFTAIPYDARPAAASPDARPSYIGSNPIADLFSARAIELTGAYLRRAFYNPHDMEARTQMMLAATLAGVGFGNAGVHLPHAMGYPIAGMVQGYFAPGYPNDLKPQVPHGISVVVGAPAAFRYTARAWPERHAQAARLLGVDMDGVPVSEAAEALPAALSSLMRDIDVPMSLETLGYGAADIPALAEGALLQQRLLKGCPRPLDERQMQRVFRESLHEP